MSPHSDHDQLTEEQLDAVGAEQSAVAILAGPGSGKTRTLCHRARHLLELSPGESVLLLTFMNKAAAEMKSRALETTSVAPDRLMARTYHALGVLLLDTHKDLLGLDELDILDADEARVLVAQAAEAVGADGFPWSFQISTTRLRDQELSGTAAQVFAAYRQRKEQLGVLDFDDLIVLAADLLDRYPELAGAFAGRYQHLLIDEFQDTNAAQFRIIRALATHAKTVTLVADDDQAIMSFAGADAGNIKTFVDELGATEYALHLNHRSRERIVEAANRLIRADELASGREMQATRSAGEVSYSEFADVYTEANWVAEGIKAFVDGGGDPADVAVLVRNGYRADETFAALQEAGLPVDDWRRKSSADRGRAYLGAALAFLRAKLSPRAATRARDILGFDVDDEENGTASVLEANAELPSAAELAKLKTKAFQGCRPSELVEGAVAVAVAAGESAETVADLELIADDIRAFEDHDPEFSNEQLLSQLALGMGSHEAPTKTAGVKVSTLHRTKGLQWPRVWIVGVEDDTLPDFRSQTASKIRDERRSLFVGVCRAEDELRLSSVQARQGWHKKPSRFLVELLP